ncbi:MAG: recombinase family protein, partial [Clostridia bacterium]|nr:recombinase family protein [Clostridia bacterium]
MDLLKIGAAYIRVSDERQDEYSPDSQLKKIREYATKDGYQIPDEYVYYNDGISGRSTRGRDEFKRMINEAVSKEHPFDKLYVWKISRFSRSMEDSIIYKSMLEKKGVKVVSVSEPISDDIYGKLMERFLEWEAQFNSERLSEEVKRGIAEKIARGEPIVPPPFGYIMKDGTYYPDEESGAANTVREMFELYENGMKMREIAVRLGERGVRTKFGNPPDNRWIEYMLRNPCFVGKLRYSTDGTRLISKRKYDGDNVLIVDGHHKPLISMELFEKVQQMLDNQKKSYPKYAKRDQPIEYLLKGLVRCSSCGSTLAMASAMSGKSQIRTMQCCNYARGSCHTSHSITMRKIEAAFMEGLNHAIETNHFVIVPKEKKNPNPS